MGLEDITNLVISGAEILYKSLCNHLLQVRYMCRFLHFAFSMCYNYS